MAFDFPNSPVDGQAFSPPGGPDYIYRTASGAWEIKTGGTGSAFVAKSGDVMTGPLVLPADPTLPLQSATKQYADTAVSGKAVRYDAAQSLTSAQQIQGRKNIYAAPFDAMAYSGLQVNGSFDVSQQFGTVGTTIHGQYPADCWGLLKNLSGGGIVAAYQQQSAYVTPGLFNYLFIGTGTAQASIAAGDYAAIVQCIEGYRCNKLNWGSSIAQPITIGFWTAHFRTGLYTGTIRNGAGGSMRNYAFSYNQAASNVWQFNVITIPGDTVQSPSSYTTGAGIYITFAMAAGSGWLAPLNAWSAGNCYGGVGQINGVQTTSDVFRLSGVLVLPGVEAPTAAQSGLIMRPYDQELPLCQRQYWQTYYGVVPGTITNAGAHRFRSSGVSGADSQNTIWLPTPMRTFGSVTFYNPTTGAVGTWRDADAAGDRTMSLAANTDSNVSFVVQNQNNTNLVLGHMTVWARL